MTIQRSRSVVIACVLGAGVSSAPASSAQSESAHERFVCKAGPSLRVISIYRDPAGDAARATGCHVDYTREGATRTVWSASTKSGYAYCVKKALSLVTTLTKDRYACTPDSVERAGEADSP
jgi:hypothetical protein